VGEFFFFLNRSSIVGRREYVVFCFMYSYLA